MAKKVDPRMEPFGALEAAFGKRDWEGYTAAAEALVKVAHEMGAAGEEYAPMFKKKAKAPEEPAPEKGVWTVSTLDAGGVRFKQGSSLFTVIRPNGNPGSLQDIVAFCDNEENATLIAKALSAYEEA